MFAVMDDNGTAQDVLIFAEMIEDQNGRYKMDDVYCVTAVPVYDLASSQERSHIKAIAMFTHLMRENGYEIYDLPSTPRTRDWGCGMLYGVTPKGGGESRVYTVVIGSEG